jgi:hypothetical protein
MLNVALLFIERTRACAKIAARLAFAAGSIDAFSAFLAAFCSGVSDAVEVESAQGTCTAMKGNCAQR